MKRNTFIYLLFCGIVLSFFMVESISFAQNGTLSREELIKWTPSRKGERFPDGRPKVPDSVIERMRNLTHEEALEAIKKHGLSPLHRKSFRIKALEEPTLF